MNLQGETYMQEFAEGAEPQDLLESADKEVAFLRASLAAALKERNEAIRGLRAARDRLTCGVEGELEDEVDEAMHTIDVTLKRLEKRPLSSREQQLVEAASAVVKLWEDETGWEDDGTHPKAFGPSIVRLAALLGFRGRAAK